MGVLNEPLTPLDAKDAAALTTTFRQRAKDARAHIAELHRQIEVSQREAETWDSAADDLDEVISRAIKKAHPVPAQYVQVKP